MNNQTSSAPTSGLTVEDRKSEFVPVSGGQETTSAGALLVTAYVLMWALVFGFVWLTAKKQSRLDARLLDVERALERLDTASPEV